jgi:hypothetical protein
MATYRKNVETMFSTAQNSLDTVAATVKHATMAFYCLHHAIDKAEGMPGHERERIHGTLICEYNYLQSQMAILEKAMNSVVDATECGK